MAQAGYTPISLYYSTTASAVPTGANLVAGELALNTNDEKLYFKNSAGTVKLLASSASTTNVQTISFGSTGLTPSTATSGAVTVAGTLAVGNGGTGITSFGTGVAGALGQNVSGSGSIALTTSPVFTTPNLGTPSAVTLTSATGLPLSTGVTGTLAIGNGGTGQTTASTAFNALSPLTTLGDILYGGASGAGTRLGIGSTSQVLTVVGGVPSWATPASGGVTTISFGSTGLTPSTATSGAVSVAGTLAVANGGTGVTTSTGSGANVLATSPTLVTPVLGTPSSGTLTSCTGLPITAGTTGTLGVARGGTGLTATPTNGQIPIGNGTGFTLATLTQGTGVTIANTAGAITISSSGGGTGTPPNNVLFNPGSTTYTPTSGMKFVIVGVRGGGGGSGGNSNGGGAQAGNAGQASSFGSLITCNGGGGGSGGNGPTNPGGPAGNTSVNAGVTSLSLSSSGQISGSIYGVLSYGTSFPSLTAAQAGSTGTAGEGIGGGGGGTGGLIFGSIGSATVGASLTVTVGSGGNGGGGGGGQPGGSPGGQGVVKLTEFFG
jgi:hypothetical protein